MNVSIAFSASHIIDIILAESALRFHTSQTPRKVLTRDLVPALHELVAPSICQLAVDTGAGVVEIDGDGEIVTMEIELPDRCNSSSFRRVAERAVAAVVAESILASVDTSASKKMGRIYEKIVANLRAMSSRPARIMPSRY